MANTGYFVRFDRGNGPEVLDITELSDDELVDYFSNKSKIASDYWAAMLAAWIRDNNPRIPKGF